MVRGRAQAGAAAALAAALALVLYPGYVLLFHRLSSDAVFAAAFAFVAVLLARAVERPMPARTAALGLGVAGLVLVRPVAQVLLLLVVVPLVAAERWRPRIRATAAFALAALAPLLGWASHNAVRADDWTLQRGGGATFPLFRVFVEDRIVEPANGPASAEVARAVARDLLPKEPYRSYGVTVEGFFESGSARMHEDLIGLSDRTWGWDDDYARLSRMGREAIRAHPTAYARGVGSDLRDLLVWPLYAELESAETAPTDGVVQLPSGPVLPTPSEGEPIPAARESAYISTPEGRIRETWTSPTEHQVVFDDADDEAGAAAIDRHVDELLSSFPDRNSRPQLVDWLNSASRWFPRPILWLAVGLVAALIRRPKNIAVPLMLAAAGLLILLDLARGVRGRRVLRPRDPGLHPPRDGRPPRAPRGIEPASGSATVSCWTCPISASSRSSSSTGSVQPTSSPTASLPSSPTPVA